jgi:hypothetical protein
MTLLDSSNARTMRVALLLPGITYYEANKTKLCFGKSGSRNKNGPAK